jgi:hypothetical protein
MWSIELNAGRLVEAKVASPADMEEAIAFQHRLIEVVSGAPDTVVLCVDLRDARVFTQDVADRVIGMLRAENKKLARGGILLPPQDAVFGLQIERLVREAAHPDRQTFREVKPMMDWLSQVLKVPEIASMRKFLQTRPTSIARRGVAR